MTSNSSQCNSLNNSEIILGSNQPYLFPYLGYWQLMNLVDTYVISDSMQYINKGYINRNNILINGQKNLLTLEVLGVHSKSLINEIEVGRNSKKLLKSLFYAYKKAPYFDDIFPLLENILLNEEKNLAKYVGYSIEKIAHFLNINTKFIYLSDLREDTNLKGQARLIDKCKQLNSSHYINAIGGQALYDKEAFKAEGINLQFLNTNIEEYKQFNNEFVPSLSIIDIIMFNSTIKIKQMLKNYTLI